MLKIPSTAFLRKGSFFDIQHDLSAASGRILQSEMNASKFQTLSLMLLIPREVPKAHSLLCQTIKSVCISLPSANADRLGIIESSPPHENAKRPLMLMHTSQSSDLRPFIMVITLSRPFLQQPLYPNIDLSVVRPSPRATLTGHHRFQRLRPSLPASSKLDPCAFHSEG